MMSIQELKWWRILELVAVMVPLIFDQSRLGPPKPHQHRLVVDFSATTPPDPLTIHFVRKHNPAGAFYEGWLS